MHSYNTRSAEVHFYCWQPSYAKWKFEPPKQQHRGLKIEDRDLQFFDGQLQTFYTEDFGAHGLNFVPKLDLKWNIFSVKFCIFEKEIIFNKKIFLSDKHLPQRSLVPHATCHWKNYNTANCKKAAGWYSEKKNGKRRKNEKQLHY